MMWGAQSHRGGSARRCTRSATDWDWYVRRSIRADSLRDFRILKQLLAKRAALDAEAAALHRSAAFQRLLDESRGSPSRPLEESNQEAEITPEEWADANRYLDELEQRDDGTSALAAHPE